MFDFDPLGFLNPCLLGIKLLIQDLCRKKLNWDDSLPSDLQKKWKYIQETFNCVYKIEVTRFYGFNSLEGTTGSHFFLILQVTHLGVQYVFEIQQTKI